MCLAGMAEEARQVEFVEKDDKRASALYRTLIEHAHSRSAPGIRTARIGKDAKTIRVAVGRQSQSTVRVLQTAS